MDEERTMRYAEELRSMIRIETVSEPAAKSPQENFERFHALMWELFPELKRVCEVSEHDGSLLMKWKGSDESRLPVMFMNHHDVVPADPQGWEKDPFSGDIADGKLWGRGTLDDKGGLWAMLRAADELAKEGFVPPCDFYFETGCDEEIRGHGADVISSMLKEKGQRFEMVFDEGGDVVKDPIAGAKGTLAMIGVGEKSVVELRFTATSEGGHASTPEKDSPLVRLGKFMAYVDSRQVFDVELSDTVREMFSRLAPFMGKKGKLIEKAEKLKRPIEFINPKIGGTVGALLATTVAFTQAGGGDAINVIPRQAWVAADMRCSHHQGQDGSIAAITKAAKKFGITTEVTKRSVESRITDHRGRAFLLAEEAAKAAIPGLDGVTPYIMTGGSDSRYFDRVCDQCVRFLPFTLQRDQLKSIHGVNEYVALNTLIPAVEYYKYLMRHI